MVCSLRWSCLFALLVCAGCQPALPPGELVGDFHVVGTLEENTCGSSGIDPIDPLIFDVEIRADRGDGIWRMDRQTVVRGGLDDEGRFTFTTRTQIDLPRPADPELGNGCTLEQREVIRGVLEMDDGIADAGLEAGVGDAGAQDRDAGDAGDAGRPLARGFEAENTIELVPTPGSQCAYALAIYGGPFLILPCQVKYTLDATARAPR